MPAHVQRGVFPLHRAVMAGVGLEVVKTLLHAFPDAVSTPDKVHCGLTSRCVSRADVCHVYMYLSYVCVKNKRLVCTHTWLMVFCVCLVHVMMIHFNSIGVYICIDLCIYGC